MKSLIILFPALAVAVLLTACAPEQPQVPQTPVSVERALEQTMQEDAMNDAGDTNNEVNADLDTALDVLQDELDSALNEGAEITIEEPAVEPAAVEVPAPEAVDAGAAAAPEPIPTPVNEVAPPIDQAGQIAEPAIPEEAAPVEEELIDQPIIIE